MMGHLPLWSLQRRHQAGPWLRRRTRRWVRANNVGQRRAQNAGYTSVSVPVPRGVLMQAIVEAMFVS